MYPAFSLLLLFAQKKEQEKGTLTVLSACGGYLALLIVGGTLKTLRLRRFKQIQRLFPPTTAMLSWTEWVQITDI